MGGGIVGGLDFLNVCFFNVNKWEQRSYAYSLNSVLSGREI